MILTLHSNKLQDSNTFYTPGGHAAFVCGKKSLSISQAQKVGYEAGSRVEDSADISVTDIKNMIRQRLGGF